MLVANIRLSWYHNTLAVLKRWSSTHTLRGTFATMRSVFLLMLSLLTCTSLHVEGSAGTSVTKMRSIGTLVRSELVTVWIVDTQWLKKQLLTFDFRSAGGFQCSQINELLTFRSVVDSEVGSRSPWSYKVNEGLNAPVELLTFVAL